MSIDPHKAEVRRFMELARRTGGSPAMYLDEPNRLTEAIVRNRNIAHAGPDELTVSKIYARNSGRVYPIVNCNCPSDFA
jgi:hypothetical protein